MLKKIKKCVQFLIEYTYLAILALLVGYMFLRTTIWPLPKAWQSTGIEYFYELSSAIPLYMDYVLMGLILLRCLITGWKGLGYLGLSSGVYAAVYYAYNVNQNRELLYLMFLILAAKDVSFKKIMWVYTVVVGILLSVTIAAAAGGVLENVSFGEEGKLAFGIVSSTDFAAHVFFIVLCCWYVWGEKSRLFGALPVLGIAAFIYHYSKARCSTVCLILLACCMAGHILAKMYTEKKGQEYEMTPVLSCVLACSVHVAAICTLILTMLYQSDVTWIQKVNLIMSNRLELGKRGLDICGFHWWGQNVELKGHWVTGTTNGQYFYLDSSYLQMTIMYGIIISVLLMFVFLMVGYRAYISKQWVLLFILALVAIHGMIEQRLWNIAYCPFLLSAFSCMNEKQEGII